MHFKMQFCLGGDRQQHVRMLATAALIDTLALVVYGGYAPVGRIHVPFTHRDCCVKKEV